MILRRSDLALLAAGLLAGTFFAASLHDLWPLAAVDLTVPPDALVSRAKGFLDDRGLDTEGYRAATVLNVDDRVLDYVEREFGLEQAQDWISSGMPIVTYRVDFKRQGETTAYSVEIHPARGVIGWRVTREEDEPGSYPDIADAKARAEDALTEVLHLQLRYWSATAATAAERIARRDHAFSFERVLSEKPRLGEQVQVRTAGDEVVSVSHRIILPGAAARAARARDASFIALETLGFILAGVAAIGAFVVFLTRLRDGRARFDRPATWVSMLFVCLLGTQLLQTSHLLVQWEPLVPLWVFQLRYLVDFSISGVWNLLVLLAVIAAGDALDQELGGGRGDSLWALSRGRITQTRVGAASMRGFLLGLVCGAVMALGVLALRTWGGAHISIQPRGFFFYALNSSSPSLSTLLFFVYVALAEELGYRYFGGSWLLRMTGRRAVAILVPALIYGLTHTRMDFLPPAEPFWGRALIMTLVGCVWGWAFFRYDALTVVMSHLTADLFIFNWPRLSSGQPRVMWAAVATIVLPLVPGTVDATVWFWRKLRDRSPTSPESPATARSRSPRGSPLPPP